MCGALLKIYLSTADTCERIKMPDTDLISAIHRIHIALASSEAALLDEIAGITINQWRVLSLVGDHSEKMSRDIAKKSCVDPAAISRAIHSLQALGWLAFRQRPSDRRVLDLELTSAGRKIHDMVGPQMRQWRRRVNRELSITEHDKTVDSLSKIERAVRSAEHEE